VRRGCGCKECRFDRYHAVDPLGDASLVRPGRVRTRLADKLRERVPPQSVPAVSGRAERGGRASHAQQGGRATGLVAADKGGWPTVPEARSELASVAGPTAAAPAASPTTFRPPGYYARRASALLANLASDLPMSDEHRRFWEEAGLGESTLRWPHPRRPGPTAEPPPVTNAASAASNPRPAPDSKTGSALEPNVPSAPGAQGSLTPGSKDASPMGPRRPPLPTHAAAAALPPRTLCWADGIEADWSRRLLQLSTVHALVDVLASSDRTRWRTTCPTCGRGTDRDPLHVQSCSGSVTLRLARSLDQFHWESALSPEPIHISATDVDVADLLCASPPSARPALPAGEEGLDEWAAICEAAGSPGLESDLTWHPHFVCAASPAHAPWSAIGGHVLRSAGRAGGGAAGKRPFARRSSDGGRGAAQDLPLVVSWEAEFAPFVRGEFEAMTHVEQWQFLLQTLGSQSLHHRHLAALHARRERDAAGVHLCHGVLDPPPLARLFREVVSDALRKILLPLAATLRGLYAHALFGVTPAPRPVPQTATAHRPAATARAPHTAPVPPPAPESGPTSTPRAYGPAPEAESAGGPAVSAGVARAPGLPCEALVLLGHMRTEFTGQCERAFALFDKLLSTKLHGAHTACELCAQGKSLNARATTSGVSFAPLRGDGRRGPSSLLFRTCQRHRHVWSTTTGRRISPALLERGFSFADEIYNSETMGDEHFHLMRIAREKVLLELHRASAEFLEHLLEAVRRRSAEAFSARRADYHVARGHAFVRRAWASPYSQAPDFAPLDAPLAPPLPPRLA
jgi:hypothetical protein